MATVQPPEAAFHPRWEHFAHGADVGIRGIGSSREEAFAQAALALTAVVADPRRIAPREPIAIACSAANQEALLFDWLNALIFEMATRRMLFSRFSVSLHDGRLEGTAWGEPLDPERHQPAVEVKGATYTELRLFRNPAGEWVAQCVVDV
ncbi:Protein archease [Methylacidimicrobium sp. AP8]|uniref:archease n=1 Tax=Methylacidimicrobium sp. AP8 TaxID=2730359 RepID=UPI0018C0158E|nr:archease [Methylacidimicrobium sp. AP8]CAB4242612.1 Protein archease [Methylacidimicrobium sp. AP8]